MTPLLLSALLALAPAVAPAPRSDETNGVPKALLSRLTTGVNVTRWFCYLGSGDQSGHFANYIGDADFRAFDRLGVKFVRLCVSPDLIDRGGKPTAELAKVDHAVDELTRRGIAVVWDLHDNGQLGLDKPGKDNSGLVSFWSALAAHYRGSHYSDLVFEVVNEPVFIDHPEVWYRLQSDVVREIRRKDPKRTIMVSPTYWSNIDTLRKMPLLPEKNLIYTFHCYDPFNFTHQGAEWMGEVPRDFKAVPFPSDPQSVADILPKNDPKFAPALEEYGKARYGDGYLFDRLKSARDWGAANHVPVLLGEFGAYPRVMPSDSRGRWFAGMRAAISELKLPNAIWGYDEGLGLGRRVDADGSLWLDPVTLESFYGKNGPVPEPSKAQAAPAPVAEGTTPEEAGTLRTVVWDGEKADKGSSWVNPTTSTFLRTKREAHSGDSSLELKFDDKGTWIGLGFDWFDWKTGRTLGTDTSRMTTLNFWIKTDGLAEDLIVQLLCNGDVIDTPEHHTAQMSIAKYCPNYRDGKWHEVVIPLRDMEVPKGYDPKVVTMVDFGFYAQNAAKGSILFDDIAFDNRALPEKSK